jgi:hypothetical protein
VPDLDAPGERQHADRKGHTGIRRLRRDDDFLAVDAIRDDAANEREANDRDGAREAIQADLER